MSKRAASMKPTDNRSFTDKRTPEEYFEEAKAGLILILESGIKNANRPDNVLTEVANLKDLGYAYDDMKLAMDMVNVKKDAYKEILDCLHDITFELITAEEYVDPLSDMVDFIDRAIPFPELMQKWAKFEAVRPFGEKVEQLRISLLDQIKAEETAKSPEFKRIK